MTIDIKVLSINALRFIESDIRETIGSRHNQGLESPDHRKLLAEIGREIERRHGY